MAAKFERNQYTTQQPQTSLERPLERGYSEKQFLWSWTAGALLPLGQSLIGGFVAMVATAGFIYVIDGIDYFKPMILIGGGTFVSMWIILARRWMILTAERITRLDINGDRHIGPPPKPRSVVVQINERTAQGHLSVSQRFDFTGFATEDQLIEFAEGMLDHHKSMAEREWTGPGEPFSIDQYRAFRSELIRRALARGVNAKSKQHGFELTPLGEKVMQAILEEGQGMEEEGDE